MTTYTRKNKGTCSRSTTVCLNDDGTIKSLEVVGGCNGNLKGIMKLVEGMKTSLAPYISTQQTKGSKVSNPPKNTGGKPTRDEIMAIKDDAERQQAIAENMDLFQ